MTVTAFDALEYFERLKAAGMPEELAKIQAETMRRQADAQSAALQRALDRYDEASRRELATKGDIACCKAVFASGGVARPALTLRQIQYGSVQWFLAGRKKRLFADGFS